MLAHANLFVNKLILVYLGKKYIHPNVTPSGTGRFPTQSIATLSGRCILGASFPEYQVVMQRYGCGPTLGPQLMSEIGDVYRFHSKKALVTYAGIDTPPYQSGSMDIVAAVSPSVITIFAP